MPHLAFFAGAAFWVYHGGMKATEVFLFKKNQPLCLPHASVVNKVQGFKIENQIAGVRTKM